MNRGFANIALIIALVVAIIGGASYWAWSQKSSAPETSATTKLPSPQPKPNVTNQVSNQPIKTQYDVETDGGFGNVCGTSTQRLVRATFDGKKWATTTLSELGTPGKDAPLYWFFSAPTKSNLIFLGSAHCFTEGGGGGIWSYSLKTGALDALSFPYGNRAPTDVSPDGARVVQVQADIRSENQTLSLLDLVKNTSTVLVTLPQGKHFEFGCEPLSPCTTSSLHWVDNSTVEYSVYESSQTPIETHRINLP
ncbi:MAG: hypothetical protein WCI89_00485 [bacterium]